MAESGRALLVANLETRRPVDRPERLPVSSESRFGMNAGAAAGGDGAARSRLPIV
jgi:hypothetical protein